MGEGLKRAIRAVRATQQVVCQRCGWSGRRLHGGKPCPRCFGNRVIGPDALTPTPEGESRE